MFCDVWVANRNLYSGSMVHSSCKAPTPAREPLHVRVGARHGTGARGRAGRRGTLARNERGRAQSMPSPRLLVYAVLLRLRRAGPATWVSPVFDPARGARVSGSYRVTPLGHTRFKTDVLVLVSNSHLRNVVVSAINLDFDQLHFESVYSILVLHHHPRIIIAESNF